jgi:steroid delta-isomerase-like uncharacterized protein
VATQASEQPVTEEFLADFVPRWEAAWRSHRPEALFELMTEDIVYDDTAWPRTMRGHEEVREFLEFTWRAFPDLSFEATDGPYIAPDRPAAAFYWRGSGTHTGPIDPPGMPPTGRRMEFEGADFHEYRDGKVARLRIVFDMADCLRQLGALPAPGSRGEKAMATLARVQARLRRIR